MYCDQQSGSVTLEKAVKSIDYYYFFFYSKNYKKLTMA